jgi:hypothetical protein
VRAHVIRRLRTWTLTDLLAERDVKQAAWDATPTASQRTAVRRYLKELNFVIAEKRD